MNEYKSQVLKDMVKNALEYLSEVKIAEAFGFAGYLLAKEKSGKTRRKNRIRPHKRPHLEIRRGSVS